jgi:hypothetical protein
MENSTNQLLLGLFNDPKTGYVGVDELTRRAKQYNPKITQKQVKEFLEHNSVYQVFQKPTRTKGIPRSHGKVGHYQADVTFLTRCKKQNNNYHILLTVINVNTKFAYVVALKDKTRIIVLDALETVRKKTVKDGRPLNVFQTDNGKEFQNRNITNWMDQHHITSLYCEKGMNTDLWIDNSEDYVENYNSAYHSGIRRIPERLEIFDEVE